MDALSPGPSRSPGAERAWDQFEGYRIGWAEGHQNLWRGPMRRRKSDKASEGCSEDAEMSAFLVPVRGEDASGPQVAQGPKSP